jgi:glycine cleavage system aminomethyltransferase T
MYSYHTWAHINKVIREKNFNASVHNVTEQIGILSIQGPNRYINLMQIRLLQKYILDYSLSAFITIAAKFFEH